VGLDFGDGNGLARQIFSITLVFGLLAAVFWRFGRGGAFTRSRTFWSRLFPRRSDPGSSANIRSLEPIDRVILTPQHTLHLLRVREQEIVLVTHPDGCTALHACSPGSEDVRGVRA